MRTPVHRWLVVTLCAGLGLMGCARLNALLAPLLGKSPPSATLESLAVIADARANRNSATALDILFVYDSSALPLLPPSAPAWFAQKDGLVNTLGHAVDVVSLQIPPPYRLPGIDMPARHRRAIRVLAYANYIAQAGQAPIDLTMYRNAKLVLLPESIDRGESDDP